MEGERDSAEGERAQPEARNVVKGLRHGGRGAEPDVLADTALARWFAPVSIISGIEHSFFL